MFKVAKFGGSSVASAEQIKKVMSIVESDPARKIVVVSAPGKRSSEDTKVTDLLIAAAQERLTGADHGAREKILQRFAEIHEALNVESAVLRDIDAALERALSADSSDEGRYVDAIKAIGEDASARTIAAAFRARSIPARYVHPSDGGMILSDEPGNARPLDIAFERLSALKSSEEIVVFPGFYGVTENDDVVTFSRGGSDITGSILAAATKADLYENFTDVDHVYAADPRVVKNAQPVTKLSFREMRELAYAGFGVFHDEALIAVHRVGIPVEIKNTNNPDAPGTVLTAEREASDVEIAGIASSGHFVSINISKLLMNREVGFTRKLLSILENEGLSYEHIPSGIDNLSLILRSDQWDEAEQDRVLSTIQDQLQPDDLSVRENLALIMVVGEGMSHLVGVAAKAVQSLANAGVNLEMINQGASEIAIMFGVSVEDRDAAVCALHDAFFGA